MNGRITCNTIHYKQFDKIVMKLRERFWDGNKFCRNYFDSTYISSWKNMRPSYSNNLALLYLVSSLLCNDTALFGRIRFQAVKFFLLTEDYWGNVESEHVETNLWIMAAQKLTRSDYRIYFCKQIFLHSLKIIHVFVSFVSAFTRVCSDIIYVGLS